MQMATTLARLCDERSPQGRPALTTGAPVAASRPGSTLSTDATVARRGSAGQTLFPILCVRAEIAHRSPLPLNCLTVAVRALERRNPERFDWLARSLMAAVRARFS
jgi:hypothetical protein